MPKLNSDRNKIPSITVEQLKRYGYSAAVLFLLLSLGTVLVFGSPNYAVSPTTKTFNSFVYPTVIVAGLLAVWAMLTGRLAVEKFEKPVVGLLAVLFVSKFTITVLGASTVLPLFHVESWYWVMISIWTLSFLACSFYPALYINLTMYMVTLGTTVTNIVLRSDQALLPDTLSNVAASNFRLGCFLIPLIILGYVKHQWVFVEEEVVMLRHISHKDALTGLPNRRQLSDTLETAVAGASTDLTIILFDLDGFKQVNDSMGHTAGDEVLRQIAVLAEGVVRAHHIVGRWGGEEFLVICPHTSLAQGTDVAEQLRHTLSSHTMLHGRPITASFGVAQLRPGETPAQLIIRADEALYAAKAQGKNKVISSHIGSHNAVQSTGSV